MSDSNFHISGSTMYSNYRINKPSILYMISYYLIQEDIPDEDLSVVIYPDSDSQEIIISTDFLNHELLPSMSLLNEEVQMMETHLEEVHNFNFRKRPDGVKAVEDISYMSDLLPFIINVEDPRIGAMLGYEEQDAKITVENATIQKVGESNSKNHFPDTFDDEAWEEFMENHGP